MEKRLATFRENVWLKAIILLACFIGAYWVPLKAMVIIWSTNEDYSSGFLIPLVSAYLLWEKRDTLKDIPVKSAWMVLPLLIVFVTLSLYGILGSSGNVSMPSVPILIILFFAFCYGIEAAKRLLLPLAFLIFMVPVPAVIERTIGYNLKIISSKLGGAIIALCDISVNVSGNVIDLGVTQLQVVDACSGMRYIFPLLAIGVIYAYFFKKVAWKRVVVVLSTIPIAILINALRIGITGILTDKFGTEMAQGFFHGFSGWALFLVAICFLFIFDRVLSFFSPESSLENAPKADESVPPSPVETGQGNITGAFCVSLALLIIVGVLSLRTTVFPAIKIQGGLGKFPLEIAGWHGKSEVVDPQMVVRSGAEESFSGFYSINGREPVSLYLGYRSTAFLSNENFFHSPTVCLPSSGWKVIEETTHTIRDVPFWGDIEVARMVVEQLGQKQLVYFWFQTKSKTTPDKNINRFHLSIHAIKGDNTHDLFIRPIGPVEPGENIGTTEKRMDQFVREMMPVLMAFLKERQVGG
jgi:exosortase D (VPLPA-CTERM-specific)